MKSYRKLSLRAAAFLLGCAGASLAFAQASHADLIVNSNRYCSTGANPSNTADTVPGSLLSVNDLSLKIGSTQYGASNCYGAFDPGNASPANETIALNTIFGAMTGPSQLTFLDATGSDNNSAGLGGITFVVGTLGGANGAPGTWTVTWTDSNGAAGSNLPLMVDLAILLSGGNNNAAYLLSSVLLPLSPTSGSGTFDIQFLNNGGRQPTISHLTLAGRIIPTPTLLKIPEPTTMALFTCGLIGLGLLSRRRRA
jgi:hypothetical protein